MADAKFSIPKLNGTNWATWKVRVENLLSREDLWDVVTDALPEGDALNAAWKTSDRKAKATIILLLEDSQLPLVKGKTYAREVFNALKAYHQKTSRSVRVSLLKKLCATNLPERNELEPHLAEIDDLFDRLEAAGTTLDSDTKICLLLRSLPPSFDGLVTALDSQSGTDLTLDKVKSKLIDDYQRRLERDDGSRKVERAMRSDESYPVKETRTCHFCKKPGHIRENCRKLAASKKGQNRQKKSDAKAKVVQTDNKGIAFVVGAEKSAAWIIDSGASAHMVNNKSFFGQLNEFVGGWISLADGKKTQILGEGTGVLNGIDGNEEPVRIDISEVKYVPGLSTNLISVEKLAQKSLKVCFDNKGCRIVDPAGTVVATGVRCGGLYHLRQAESSMQATGGQHKPNCQHLWHRRLGHRDWAAAQRLVKENLASGVKVSDCGLRLVCECCLEAKAARAPFPPVIERKSTQVLDIIHTDLCGPMKTTTPSGNRYVMNLIDDYSRFTVTILLKNKWEATQNIIDYVRWTENLFGRKPRVIRSDGGGEFDNKELRKFYKAEGIQPQFSTPYSPQSNGVAERKNRSLNEMATCMLVDSGLEKRYWGEAILTATYLQNRLPSRSVAKTPFELWWGRKPDIGHLRVFGSEAYVHVPEVRRSKLDAKAKKLNFVGYSMEHKAYRFVDRETDSITISRDARFIECGNGTSSVEFSISVPDDIKLLPFKEEPDSEEEGGDPIEEEAEVPTGEEKEEVPTEEEPDGEEEDGEELDSENSATAGQEEASGGLRRSKRKNKGAQPHHFDDFLVGIASCAIEEPEDFQEAIEQPEWRNAMEEEMNSHRRIGTWDLVPRPQGRRIVGSKWVYKLKRNEAGEVVKCKARVVAQGYTQQAGIDFGEVFAPVTRQATLRTFLTVAANRKLFVQHLDVKTAYLNGILEEEIFMRQPPGFATPGQEELVCRLKRSIYGLRQSARCWNRKLNEVLSKLGFKASAADRCLYVKESGEETVFLLVYVDDMLLSSADEAVLKRVYQDLTKEFELTCLGEIRHFLGMEVQREDGVYQVRLKQYIDKLVRTNGMEEAKPARSPMESGYLKSQETSKLFDDATKYRSLVGGLLYLSVIARPDIAAVTAILGRKFSAPNEADWTAAKRVLRYLKATSDSYLQLGGDGKQPLIGYSDADWAGDPESRRSSSGAVFYFGGGTISWASRRQSCVTLSSMEAEYVALSEACQETIWLRQLLRDFGETQTEPTTIKEDNQGCLAFVKTERSSRRSKHIDTKEKFIQELCESKEIKLEYCPTDSMVADIMTKPLGPQKHQQFVQMLGLVSDA